MQFFKLRRQIKLLEEELKLYKKDNEILHNLIASFVSKFDMMNLYECEDCGSEFIHLERLEDSDIK